MDIQLSYVVAGSGFPLVLLHGNGEDHSYFKRQFEPFAQHYRVIAPDTRGHGRGSMTRRCGPPSSPPGCSARGPGKSGSCWT